MTTTDRPAERARALLANISPGEWRAQQVAPRPGFETGYITVYSYASPYVCSVPGVVVSPDDTRMLTERQSANAAFIAAAPALVRDLLAELDATREVLLEMSDEEGFPPGWLTQSANTKPLSCCGYCGALAVYQQDQRAWECDHYDDCTVTRARALLGGDHD